MFKVGDKLVCIDDSPLESVNGELIPRALTKYKYYEIVQVYSGFLWMIINDDGTKTSYSHDRFTSLCEYRKMKLEKICQNLVHRTK